MIRAQRNTHAWVWPVLGAGLAAGVAIGLSSRRSEPVQRDPAPGLDGDLVAGTEPAPPTGASAPAPAPSPPTTPAAERRR